MVTMECSLQKFSCKYGHSESRKLQQTGCSSFLQAVGMVTMLQYVFCMQKFRKAARSVTVVHFLHAAKLQQPKFGWTRSSTPCRSCSERTQEIKRANREKSEQSKSVNAIIVTTRAVFCKCRGNCNSSIMTISADCSYGCNRKHCDHSCIF